MYDVVLIDTAGRLHNKFNLMEELAKIKSVIDNITIYYTLFQFLFGSQSFCFNFS